jgi:transposase
LLTDTQSTKCTDQQNKSQIGYDGGKKIKGIKKSITVDTTGFPPNANCIRINTANTSERKMCYLTLEEIQQFNPQLIKNVTKVICDGGYDGIDFINSIKTTFDIEIEITQRTDIKNGIVSKIRWISERTFAWLDKCRRLCRNYESSFRSVKSMIVLAFIRLSCRRLIKD